MAEADPLRWKALTIVCAAFFMTVLDVSIVNVALPSIGKSLHFSRESLQWVVTAYAITFGGFLLLGGRAADLLGRRRVFLVGVLVFTAASFFCGLAWSDGVLIGSRAVQGLGAAIISPAALSIIMTTFEEGAERNKALGIWGAIGGGGAAVGVLAGGLLTKYLGWEWIFFVNVPVGVLAFGLAPRFVRESRLGRDSTQDIAGAVTVTAGLALLVYAVSTAPDHGWGSGWTLSRLAVSVVLLAAFLVIEARAKDPLMPFSIFRVRTVAGANVAGLLLGGVLFANFFILTLYVQQVLGYSALKTGITFVATAGSAVLFAGLAQALVTKVGAKPIMAIGFVAMIAGMLWYTQIPVHASFASDLLPGYLLVGFGIAVRVHSRVDRSACRHPEPRGRPRVGADQHRAAGGRRGGRRRRLFRVAQPLQPPRRQGGFCEGVHERLAVGLLDHGRGRCRGPNRDADAGAGRRTRRAGGRSRAGPEQRMAYR